MWASNVCGCSLSASRCPSLGSQKHYFWYVFADHDSVFIPVLLHIGISLMGCGRVCKRNRLVS